MSGYQFVIGDCFGCGRIFSFNADHVPSIPIDPETGLPPDMGGDAEKCVKQPLCRFCVNAANPHRVARGLDPIFVHPDAYEPQEV